MATYNARPLRRKLHYVQTLGFRRRLRWSRPFTVRVFVLRRVEARA